MERLHDYFQYVYVIILRIVYVLLLYYFQYDTDFYILDKYPLAIRPFYTMPDPNNSVSVQLF